MLARSTPEMRGRVMSLNMMMWGFQPLGLLPIGAAAEVLGTPLAIRIGGIIVASVAFVFLVFSRSDIPAHCSALLPFDVGMLKDDPFALDHETSKTLTLSLTARTTSLDSMNENAISGGRLFSRQSRRH